MSSPFTSYEAPNSFVKTNFQAASPNSNVGPRIPVYIGVGKETLRVNNVEMVRGSSSVVDTKVYNEDVSARFVLDETNPAAIVLGPTDGTKNKVRVRNFPIVRGDGNGIVTNEPKYVTVTVDDEVVNVASVSGVDGFIFLETAPSVDSVVKVTYHFKRTDTKITDDVSDQVDGSAKTFKVYQGPIVDGRNGGVTTTSPSDVTVKVNGLQVVPKSVDGANRTVTLADAPLEGSTVTVTYYFNTWQDTFDYLEHNDIVDVLGVGFAPDRADYINTVDFVIDNGKIIWGASAQVAAGLHTPQKEFFDDTQVRPTLVDNKIYLEQATAVVDLTVTPAVTSRTQFRLANTPTLGNGRSTPLGQDLYNSLSNGRVDVTSDRPDLVEVYTGVDIQDALSRASVAVVSVDGTNKVVTLKNPVQLGHNVFCTYYYNLLSDDTFTLEATEEGGSLVGKYTVKSAALGDTLKYGAVINGSGRYVTKASALSAIDLNFPSGSELLPDIIVAGGNPVTEEVTVTFASKVARAAQLTGANAGPFNIIPGQNDKFFIQVDAGVATAVNLTASLPAVVTASSPILAADSFNGQMLKLKINSSDQITITLGSPSTPIVGATAVRDRINTVLAADPRFNGAIDNSTKQFATLTGVSALGGTLVLTTENMDATKEAPVGTVAKIEIMPDSVSTANPVIYVAEGSQQGTATPVATIVADINAAVLGVASVSSSKVKLLSTTTGALSLVKLTHGVTVGDIPKGDAALATLGFEHNEFDNGEDAGVGFNVTSSDLTNGSSGSGNLGQTYTDARTGVRFTVLPPVGGGNYPTVSSWFKFNIGAEFRCESNLPMFAIPGVETIVTSTEGVGVGDTAIVTTYNKGGNEPAIGDFYYVSYDYKKPLSMIEATTVFTKMKDIEANYGTVSVQNRLSLGAYLGILNGAQQVACRQVVAETGKSQASAMEFIKAIDALKTPLAGGIKPYVLCPLTTSQEVINFLRKHNEIMSSERYRSERIGVFGFAANTKPTSAMDFLRTVQSRRMIGIYPDSARIGLTNELGETEEFVVDGSFLAAGFTGLLVAPAFDAATPLTRRQLVGYRGLPRRMDSVEMNQVASTGCVVLEDLDPSLLIRHALTTDMSTVLTREISVQVVSDTVQMGVRQALEQFIGVKFLERVLTDIENTLTAYFNSLKEQEIIVDFKGVSAVRDEDDPTVVRVEAFYSPVFPLNYILVTLNLRTRL